MKKLRLADRQIAFALQQAGSGTSRVIARNQAGSGMGKRTALRRRDSLE